ncbi:perlucin-like protein [Dendropsophus ebraccatus]|uniref:perlucin-like protein n=1 Tax=Dendropsophus ebraccatus TaxID=150705 RepID=UPI003831FC3A
MRDHQRMNIQDDTRRGESSGNIKKVHMILGALIFLIILFIILVAVTSVLLKYYIEVREELSGLKNHTVYIEITCTPCPDGWNMIGCSCYYVSEEKTNWDDARDKCYNMNAVLVMVKDKTEMDILNKLHKMDRRYWIGLRRDPEKNETWKWLDGTQISFNNWYYEQPDNYQNNEECGESQDGSWNDIHCTDKLYYICKG